MIAREIVEETAPVSIALTRQLLWRFASEPNPMRIREVDVPMSRELGASAELLVSLVTDGTPRGMASMMALGMLGAVITDFYRRKADPGRR